MILKLDIEAKTIGNTLLFHNLSFIVEAGEKVALIGRNGVGKTTLFNMLDGKDADYEGTIQLQKGIQLVATAQEHHKVGQESVIAYVLHNLPEYKTLKHIIDTYPETMGDNLRKIQDYTNALDRFDELGYYDVESRIVESLKSYQIDEAMARTPMSRLSGGQKRFVELVRVEQAHADLALIDEPTNHMDYVAKAAFIKWLKAAQQTVMVITHDRDVLAHVDKIIEIKDNQAFTFKGNYEAYLKQNTALTAASMNDYEVGLKTLDNLHKQILWARARKPSWHGTADQKNPFVVMEVRLQKQYDQLKESLDKPSFWIDRESAEGLGDKASDNYVKYKAKNIRIRKAGETPHLHELLRTEELQLGYNSEPLFKPVSFALQHGERLQLIGRNGAGKTTLIRALVAASTGARPETQMAGNIICSKKLRLSVYEQEVDPKLMQLTLAEAIEQIYRAFDLEVNDEIVMRAMGDYLFDPHKDAKLTIEQLSGGQKARLQIIKMLANNPNLLILDEPTNHLDLPSIEELENALINYQGALLYVSHDSYFAKHMGGERLPLETSSPSV
jgi:ATPase subunit of ABC transporter with duplicated ATPase domains